MSSSKEPISIQESGEEETRRLQEKVTDGQRGLSLNLDGDKTYSEFPIEVLNLSDLRELHLSIGNLSSIPNSITSLRSLQLLELRNHDFETFPVSVCGLECLEVLDLSKNNISLIPDEITHLHKLEKLILESNKLEGELCVNISTLPNLQHLNVSKNSLTAIPDAFQNLRGLQHLILSDNAFIQFPIIVNTLTKLKTLDISYNDIKELSDISGLSQLENLDLESTSLTVLDDVICSLNSLRRLDLGCNNVEVIPCNFSKLTNLKALWLNHNKLKCFPEVIRKLSSLENLSLSYNSIMSLPSSIAYLENLKMLELDHCGLKKMPLGICMLQNLQLLSLADNDLTKLPPVLRTALPDLSFINLENNTRLVGPPYAISRRGIKAIFTFMDGTESQKIIYHKIVIIGNVNAGKTSLAKSMIHNTSYLSEDDDKTIVLDKILWTPEENLSLQVYDFGGSEWYSVAQHFFLEGNPIVVLVVNLQEYSMETYTDCVEKWVKVIQARAPGAKLFLVATHIDLLSEDEVKAKQDSILEIMNERNKREVEHIHKVIKRLQHQLGREAESAVKRLEMSLKDRLSLPGRVFIVSSKTLENFKEFKDDLLDTAKGIGGFIPTAWLQLYDELHNSELSKSKSFLTVEEVFKLFKNADENFQARPNLSPNLFRKPPLLQTQRSEDVKSRVSRRRSPNRKPSSSRCSPTENDDRTASRDRLATVNDRESIFKKGLSSEEESLSRRKLDDVLSFFHSIGDVLWYEGNPEIRKFVFHKQSFVIDLMKGIFSESPDTIAAKESHIILTQAMSEKALKSAKDDLKFKGILSVGFLKGMLGHLHLEDDLIDAVMQLLIHFGLCFTDEAHGNRITELHFPWFLSQEPPSEASLMLGKQQLHDCQQFILEYAFPLGCPRALFEITSVRMHGVVLDKSSIKHWEDGICARIRQTKIMLHRSKRPESETINFSVKGKDVVELWRILRELNALFKRLLAIWPGTIFEKWLVCPHCTRKGLENPYYFRGENIEEFCPDDEEYVTCRRNDEDNKVAATLVYPVLVPANCVSEGQILKVSKRISRYWHSLGRSLGLDVYELTSIDDDYRYLGEKSIQMMRLWQRTKGKKATLKRLIEALESMDPKQQSIIDELTDGRVVEQEDFNLRSSKGTVSLHNKTI